MKDTIIEKQKEIIKNLKEVGTYYFEVHKKGGASLEDVQRMKKLTEEGERLESELSALQSNVKTTSDELYKKIYIKSESDLPKDNADYVCKVAGNEKTYVFDGQIIRDYGLSIDWYLHPLQTEEQPLEVVFENGKKEYWLHGKRVQPKAENKNNIVSIIAKYAVKPKAEAKGAEIPTILNEKEKYELTNLREFQKGTTPMNQLQFDRLYELAKREFGFDMGYDNPFGNLFKTNEGKVIQGGLNATQPLPSDLKKQLKDFNSWMCGKQYDGRIPMIDTCIDEYIKSITK